MQRRASSVKSGRGFLLNDNTALAARKMQRRGTTDIEREPGLQKKPRRKAGPKSTFSLSRAQSRTCSGYAEARKRREKTNVFVKPSAESNLFRLCRGERTKNEIQPELPIAYEVERSRKKETERCANTAPSGRLTPATYLSKY